MLIFQAKKIESLDRVFPRLAVIRGQNLFKNYSLVIFLTNSLLQLNLKALISINRGQILFSRLYNACFIKTIDWDYLSNEKQFQSNIELTNNECFNEKCHSRCNYNCWNSEKDSCQLKCPDPCKYNCYIDKPNKCCENKLCMHCESKNSISKCLSCSKYRNLIDGKCVFECPTEMLIYEDHSCIKHDDCSRNSKSMIKSYHIFNNTFCVKECPNGFSPKININTNMSYCVRCKDNVCKRDCSKSSFIVKSLNDLKKIEKCSIVKRLHIEFKNIDILNEELVKSFQYLEEIEEYLVVVRNRYLKSLTFFKNLRLIRGNFLFWFQPYNIKF